MYPTIPIYLSVARGIPCRLYYRSTPPIYVYAVDLIDIRKTDIPFNVIVAAEAPGNLKGRSILPRLRGFGSLR